MEEDNGLVIFMKRKIIKKQKKIARMTMKKPMKAKKKAAKKASNMARKTKAPKKAVKMTMKKPIQKLKSKAVPAKAQKKALVKQIAKVPVLSPVEKRKPRCIVLAGFGLNAEVELAHAFTLAGADARIVHFSDISSGKVRLSHFEIFAIPGGWSFGDDIAGGRVLSNKLKSTFRSQFEEFVKSGKPILGVCNGFQTLVKLGALPNVSGAFSQESTLTFNKSGKFENRWVTLKPQKSACKYFEGVEFIQCPVRHGEGQFIPRDEALLSSLKKEGMVALCYVGNDLKENPGYPANPNGSPMGIAGICDKSGKILGLMPHPECSVRKITFPRFREGISSEKNSLRFFENIVKEGAKYV